MSHQATAWALDSRRTGPLDPSCRLVLVALADYANPEGRNAFPSVPTLEARLDIKDRQIRRHIATLRDAELIRPGDARLVDHIPSYARPNVWDLAIDTPCHPRHPLSSKVGATCHGGSNRPVVDDNQSKNITTPENSPQTPHDDDDPALALRLEQGRADVMVSRHKTAPKTGTCRECLGEDLLLVAAGLCRRCLIARGGEA